MELNQISERYQKLLVTVAMGFRTEEDVYKNGLSIFSKSQKQELIDFVIKLFEGRDNLLLLKIKKAGFRSEHINIKTQSDLDMFLKNVNSVFDVDNEIWVVESSVKECWRCRLYLTNDIASNDRFEMAYSNNDHALDSLCDSENKLSTPFIRFEKRLDETKFKVNQSNLDIETEKEAKVIFEDICLKFNNQIKNVKQDLDILGLNGISLDVRVNNGYDFHDFDVSYSDIKKVIDYYVVAYLKSK